MKMPGFSQPTITANTKAPVQAVRRELREKKGPVLTPEQTELVEIMKRHEWTQDHFAKMLGITMPALISYVYGRTKTVPDEVIKNARLYDREEKTPDYDKFHNVSMTDILKKWCEFAGEDYDTNRTLSVMCHVSIPTITRWKKGTSRPSSADLLKIEYNVTQFLNDKKNRERETKELLDQREAA